MAYSKSLEIFMRQEWRNFDMCRLLVCFFVVDCGTRGTKKVKKIMSNAPTIEESQKNCNKKF